MYIFCFTVLNFLLHGKHFRASTFVEAYPHHRVVLEDKSENEQIKLINQLDEEDKSTILKIIDTMLTKKKFKDFFNKNIAAL